MAAIYLAAIIHAEGYDMDYIPSALPFPQNINISNYDLIILSDYPREQIKDERLEEIADFTIKRRFIINDRWLGIIYGAEHRI